MSVGRLFHTRGAATANARSPNLLRVRGTYRSPLSAARNEARDGRSATGLIRSAMQPTVVHAQQVPCEQADIVWSRSFQRSEASVIRATLEWHGRTVAGWRPFVLLHGGHAPTNLVWSAVLAVDPQEWHYSSPVLTALVLKLVWLIHLGRFDDGDCAGDAYEKRMSLQHGRRGHASTDSRRSILLDCGRRQMAQWQCC